MTSGPAADKHLRDLALLRRVRDRIDREYAQPLDVEALARDVHMSAGHLSRQFKQAYGETRRQAGDETGPVQARSEESGQESRSRRRRRRVG